MFLLDSNFRTKSDFFTALNNARLANKGQWLAFNGTIGNSHVQLKTFSHTYLQVFKINGIDCSTIGMDSKVGDWKKCINDSLARHVKDAQ